MHTTPVLLGCVADDLTGATDLADTLVRAGLRTVLLVGAPDKADQLPPGTQAVVVALKSRMAAPEEAVARSLDALDWLRERGARFSYLKICSTFDSTDQGNIGPVADAMAEVLGADVTVVCPAFPTNGRTVYAGHLFVGDVLLSESSMRHHPLTPMTDPSLVRVLGRQSRRPVGLVHLAVVRQGPVAVCRRLDDLLAGESLHAIADAVLDQDLDALGQAVVDHPVTLCVGGSGLAGGLARALNGPARPPMPAPVTLSGPAVVISGSCSEATRLQVAAFRGRRIEVDPLTLPGDVSRLEAEVVAAVQAGGPEPVLVSSTAEPDRVAAVQAARGGAAVGADVEATLGRLAAAAVGAGARRVVVAGGETSGAVAAALGVRCLRVGPMIAPGVPWTEADLPYGRGPVALALKSGNFGGPDFFARALEWGREQEGGPKGEAGE